MPRTKEHQFPSGHFISRWVVLTAQFASHDQSWSVYVVASSLVEQVFGNVVGADYECRLASRYHVCHWPILFVPLPVRQRGLLSRHIKNVYSERG